MSTSSSSENKFNIDPEILERILQPTDGPLKNVEGIEFLKPLSVNLSKYTEKIITNRGPRSTEERINEIRKDWRNINNEDKLQKSWLSSLPQIESRAASQYGGAAIGRGIALSDVLQKALEEAKKRNPDKVIMVILTKYPETSQEKIGSEFNLSREIINRNYMPKAAKLLTLAFQYVLEHDDQLFRSQIQNPQIPGKTILHAKDEVK